MCQSRRIYHARDSLLIGQMRTSRFRCRLHHLTLRCRIRCRDDGSAFEPFARQTPVELSFAQRLSLNSGMTPEQTHPTRRAMPNPCGTFGEKII